MVVEDVSCSPVGIAPLTELSCRLRDSSSWSLDNSDGIVDVNEFKLMSMSIAFARLPSWEEWEERRSGVELS